MKVPLDIKGFIRIEDYDTNEVVLDVSNAIHFENMSEALAMSLANRDNGRIYSLAFGNGGSSVDQTGIVTYLSPNVVGQNADLFNQTYQKIVNDTHVANTDPSQNHLAVQHIPGRVYTDIVVTCVLDYGEPVGQHAFDNATDMSNEFVFDEMGLKVWNGSETNLRLVTHAIFNPVQKALNRRFKIYYTIRIQTLTHLSSHI